MNNMPTECQSTEVNLRDQILEETEEYKDAHSYIKTALAEVAAETYYDLRPSSVIMHKILLLDPKMTPIRQKIRRVPYSKLEEFKKLLQDQLDAGIIVPSDSAWCSPVNLVMKSDGSIRITIDYKKLNDACVKDAYPIPHMESLYTKLTHSKFYTKIDCFNGYYQILTDPETSHLTSFGCEFGLFKYVKLAQGLANAPATFQRMVDTVFKDQIARNTICVYFDDFLIHTKTGRKQEGNNSNG